MFSLSKLVGVISCTFLTFLVALTGCQSTTGKTAGETISDASISTAVQTKLTSDRLSNFPRINVETERGVVNLSGVVETEAQRAHAASLAQQVKGVVKVNNNLQIQNRPPAGKTSHATQSDDMKSSPAEHHATAGGQKEKALQAQEVRIIQGEVLRVEGDNYFVKGKGGRAQAAHHKQKWKEQEKLIDPVSIGQETNTVNIAIGPGFRP